MNELARIIGSNPEAARLYVRGVRNPDTLEIHEVVQFASLLHLALNALYQRYESGLDITDDFHFANLQHPGFATYWARQSASYPDGFRRIVSQAIQGGGDEAAGSTAAADR